MIRYADYRPTSSDSSGLGCEDRQDWLVAPCGTNRGAGALQRANWKAQKAILDAADTGEDVEEHRFGHWACGWFDIVLVRPGSKAACEASALEGALEDYPIVSEEVFSEEEAEEADQIFANCYRPKERIELLRESSSAREGMRGMTFGALVRCVKDGTYWPGDASELVEL